MGMAMKITVIGLVACSLFLGLAATGPQEDKPMDYRKLTPEEKRVIVHKGTEPPFTGKYNKHKEPGTYVCKRCGAELYRSDDKFESHCGWPSFDDEIPGAVKRQTDADGVRTEILCANCGAHLGHIFKGERLTKKNVRHCVNSISLEFVPAPVASGKEKETGAKRAYFAGGCFWGVEYYLKKAKGVLSTQVGYMGGDVEKPGYKQVCTGRTGHAETVEVEYDPNETSFEELARLFFEIHDPSQRNRQGPDVGHQYRSAIFYTETQQRNIAEQLVTELRKKDYNVVTEIEQAGRFWPAEDYHQDYYQKSGKQPYCHVRVKRF